MLVLRKQIYVDIRNVLIRVISVLLIAQDYLCDIKSSDAYYKPEYLVAMDYGDGDWPQIDANKLPENPSLRANIFHPLPSLVAAAGMRDEGGGCGERDGFIMNKSCAVARTVISTILLNLRSNS